MSTETMTARFIRALNAGAYDDRLEEILTAVKKRQTEMRRSRTIREFGIGDVVKFNDYCGTKYMHGQIATVVGLRKTKLVVKMQHPTGRFARLVDGKWESSEIVVPPSIVDLV